MPWYHAVIESQHELQNPTSPEKIRLLGERMRLGGYSSVLDMASGRGGPAIILAQSFGCHVVCVEKSEEFDMAARMRAREAGVDSLIEFVRADAREFPAGTERYDAVICLGASFVWEGLAGTLDALKPAVRLRGFVAVGEPYWRTAPPRETVDPEWAEEYVSLADTVDRFRATGLDPVTIIDASLDDWDRYETLHWLAGTEWLNEHPDDPDSDDIRASIEHDRDRYVQWQRELLGWAIIAAERPEVAE